MDTCSYVKSFRIKSFGLIRFLSVATRTCNVRCNKLFPICPIVGLHFTPLCKCCCVSGGGDGFYSTGFQSQLEGNRLHNISMPDREFQSFISHHVYSFSFIIYTFPYFYCKTSLPLSLPFLLVPWKPASCHKCSLLCSNVNALYICSVDYIHLFTLDLVLFSWNNNKKQQQ